jgi:hypothetical protein
MEPIHWAIVLKPIVVPIFMFTMVAPVAWLLFKMFPNGRLKVVLFKDRSGPEATRRDKVVMALGVVGAYIVLTAVGVVAYHS